MCNGKVTSTLQDLMAQREGDEVPLIIFTEDLQCSSGFATTGCAYM